jgi:hypothetical protein
MALAELWARRHWSLSQSHASSSLCFFILYSVRPASRLYGRCRCKTLTSSMPPLALTLTFIPTSTSYPNFNL